MKTKCIVIGEDPKTELKSIELELLLEYDMMFEPTMQDPRAWKNLELICKDYFSEGYDLIFAYSDGERNEGFLYLGHWNDGIV